ncbi:MAG: phosphoglucosamine mutase [Cohaesibacteraceae bacterium]
MVRRFFGTDGIRGKANAGNMTADVAMRVGMAAGRYFRNGGERRHRVIIGKDTRLSGYMIESAMMAGFTSVGIDVFLVGPMPTPAIAMLTRSLRCDLGVMISASHTAFHDNGIKLFGPEGYKLSDEIELEIERLKDAAPESLLVGPSDLGRAKRVDGEQARYIEFAKRTLPRSMSLSGMRVVLDCANGAAYKVAPAVLWELGAEVITIGDEPNGFNINADCGSTKPQALCDKVKELRADVGIALDGDADRVVLVNEKGAIVQGDQLMAVVAASWRAAQRLSQPGVVATVMSNLGLERYLEGIGLGLVRTKVGDRYVVERMRSDGYNVGGEQSGHIILSDYVTTGDGLVSALQILAVVAEQEQAVSAVCSRFEPVPQILKNVAFEGSNPLQQDDVQAAVEAAEKRLGNHGRLVIRPSGTEPLIRVMAEGDDPDLVETLVDELCDTLRKAA